MSDSTKISNLTNGFSSPAQDYNDGRIDLNKHLIKDITSTFILRVEGSGMEDSGISAGDEIIVDRSVEPTNGMVIVAIVGGELYVRRLKITSSGISLCTDNQEIPDIKLSGLEELRVWGVVTRSLHHVNQ